jgi:hypothetical protein
MKSSEYFNDIEKKKIDEEKFRSIVEVAIFVIIFSFIAIGIFKI